MEPSTWTPEKVQWLKDVWLTDLTTPEMAATLGTTKNAVTGKAFRLHLPKKINRQILPLSGDDLSVLTRRLRQRRLARGLLAKTVACDLGVNVHLVARWETRDRLPSLRALIAWVNYLGLSLTVAESDDGP